MVLLHLFDESQTRLADFYLYHRMQIENPRGLNEISLPLANNEVGSDNNVQLNKGCH